MSSLFCNESACWPKLDMGVGVPSLCRSHITPTHSEALLQFTLQSFAYHLLCVHLVKLVYLGVERFALLCLATGTEGQKRKAEKEKISCCVNKPTLCGAAEGGKMFEKCEKLQTNSILII